MPKKKRSGGSSGFKSRAQWRLFFARPDLRRYAKKKARATPGGKVTRYRRLPYKKRASTGRKRR